LRIITVNIPETYLKAIDKLTGQKGLYTSRSELIRVAVRQWLIKDMEKTKSFMVYQYQKNKSKKPIIGMVNQGEDFVRVPINETEYKTYKLVKR